LEESQVSITKEQFGLWKHEPVTKWFLEFLNAKKEFLKSAALDEWLAGKAWPEAIRGQIIELEEIANVDRSAILAFYGIEEKEDDGFKSESGA
jgi:hypothetical protein